jgi:DNA repair exonuclease SbcCD nuclease subunit
MKIAIVGDCHLGARNGSGHFSDYFNRFFSELLYPYCKKNGIKTILQLGDIFDNRTNLSYKAFHRCKDAWFSPLAEHGIEMHVLLGNHDICYRHTLEINSPELLLGEYENIHVIKEQTQLKFGNTTFDVIPWICDENHDHIMEFIKRKDRGMIALGHLELGGFPMSKGQASHEGMSASIFDQYSLVFSGHYHTRSEKGNIIYTGIPYEITWSDYADPKGFYVYDTIKNTYEFIRNPLTMFEKVQYQNGSTVNITSLAGKIVKVIVGEKKDPVLYERWLDSIRLVSPYELSVIETQVTQLEGELDDTIEIGDTSSLIKNYIDQIDTTVSKDDLNKYMQNLYAEALTYSDTI